MSGLSQNQRRVLDFINTFIEHNHMSPSYVDIMQALGFRSKASISRYLVVLRDRGYIDYSPKHARSISILFPESTQPNWESIARSLLLQNRELRACLDKIGWKVNVPEIVLPEIKKGKRNG